MIFNNKCISTESEIANAFAGHVKLVYEMLLQSCAYKVSSSCFFPFSCISEIYVLSVIKQLQLKSTGIDNIPTYIDKCLAEF